MISQSSLAKWTAATMLTFVVSPLSAEPFVPGTGERVPILGDDFEAEDWSYAYRHPKSSYEQDENQRGPGGRSQNGHWYEGGKRGTPDMVKRVPTPPGGLEGSTGALMIATRRSGIPGRVTNKQQQDDLLMAVRRRLKKPIPVSWQPSCLVRVYLPPFEKWENRTGASFGIRADVRGSRGNEVEPYWPGMFIFFQSETSRRIETDSARVTVRADRRGRDVRGPNIAEPGWWTFGMSFTRDGQVHHYASPGVDDLTADDYLYSSYPYGYRCRDFHTFFFNVANWDNGRTWSTPWVIDDPEIYVITPQGRQLAQLLPRERKRRQSSARKSDGSKRRRTASSNKRRSASQNRAGRTTR